MKGDRAEGIRGVRGAGGGGDVNGGNPFDSMSCSCVNHKREREKKPTNQPTNRYHNSIRALFEWHCKRLEPTQGQFNLNIFK